MDISKIKLSGTDYTLKDPVARGEETETEGISHIEIGGVSYDVKDIVARGEGEATENEISKVSVGGKVYQIKDTAAREAGYDYYFAVYSADDDSLTFYGDNELPDAGTQYRGKTATNVYTGVEDTGLSFPPWFSEQMNVKTVAIDDSFAGARPTSCHWWFFNSLNCTAITGLGNLNTSSVTDMSSMFQSCDQLTTIDVSGWDTSSVTDMSSMFRSCDQLTTLDVSGWDTSSVTDMSYMFMACDQLTTIYSDDSMFVTTAVTSGDDMFFGCDQLEGGNGTRWADRGISDCTMAHIDTPDNPGYFTDINDKD